jgi:hypothetical protein
MLARLSHTKPDEKAKADKPKEEQRKDEKRKDKKPKDDKHQPDKRKARPQSSKAPAPVMPTPARLLLRVHSAKELHSGAFSQGIYCKLYVGETAMVNGSEKSLFSKKAGNQDGDHGDKDAAANGGESATHRIFRTRTVPAPADTESAALWDENFDVLVPDASKDILSVRVKSKHRLFPAVLGVCAIPLWQLRIGHSVDKWVPLLKGTREVAKLRLQIVLSPITNPDKLTERSKSDLQADIKTALAANQSAEDAIDRLISSGTFKHSRNGGAAIILPANPEELLEEFKKGNGELFHDENEIKRSRGDDGEEPFHQKKNDNEEDSAKQKEEPFPAAPVAITSKDHTTTAAVSSA